MGIKGRIEFTADEDALVKAMWANGNNDRQISLALAMRGTVRTQSSVNCRRFRLGAVDHDRVRRLPPVQKQKIDARRGFEGDRQFKLAMLAAIYAGSESPLIGVVKDRRPLPMVTYQPEPVGAGYSSPGAMCAAEGWKL